MMGGADDDRKKAATLPEGDVIGVLYGQHARIQDLFERVEGSSGEQRETAFDELRVLLALHETGEELVLRPVSRETAGEGVVEARNKEEDEATRVLADLEKMDVSSAEFERSFAKFKQAVVAHAEHEEKEEFPTVVQQCDEDERQKLGERLTMAEKTGLAQQQPVAASTIASQNSPDSFASMLERARDTLSDK